MNKRYKAIVIVLVFISLCILRYIALHGGTGTTGAATFVWNGGICGE